MLSLLRIQAELPTDTHYDIPLTATHSGALDLSGTAYYEQGELTMLETSHKSDDVDDDELLFAEDDTANELVCDTENPPWKVMLVDDDADVIRATKMVLKSYHYLERPLEFVCASSATEARNLLRKEKDIAVIFLDVVMETDNAGLDLVHYIRKELNNFIVRIILRTGQPGMAPEQQIIVDYEINDYKDKSELTAQKLHTTLTTSLRDYQHVKTIEQDQLALEANKRGLERIIKASSSMFELQSIREFSNGVLTQLKSILGLDIQSVYTKCDGFSAMKNGHDFRILAATGQFADHVNSDVGQTITEEAWVQIQRAVAERKNQYGDDFFVCHVQNSNGEANVLYVHDPKLQLSESDRDLIELFNANTAIAFENIYLNREIENTQKEIIYTLGEVTEVRSNETGYHVKRVGEYSRILANNYGLPQDEVKLIKMASPLHDVGKVGICDSVLNKPGRLTPEERKNIETHASLGYEMLRYSKRKLLQTAATIAHEHHEHYNGNGYPNGLKGEDINIFGRITAIADVFDALGSDRIYRQAWDDDRIHTLFREESGKQFDPQLIDVFFASLPELNVVRSEFAD